MRLTRHHPADIRTTSSLQSSPPPAASAEDGPSNLQRAPSPAFSTSSTADEGGSSPILPPLPQPTFNGHTVELARITPPSSSGRGAASSHYYTASWGSPYQQPHPSSNRAPSYAHSRTLSSETSEDSPIRHLEFHTPFLRPAPTFARTPLEPDFVSQDGLISAAVLANRARRPPTGLTEDWIRQHTGGESAERNNWLSDDPGESETSSLSGSISGDGSSNNFLGEEDPRTPTLKRFLQARQNRRIASRRHRRQPTTDTLRQADFDDSQIPKMTLENKDAMEGMEVDMQSPAEERPPTPPPKEKEWRAAALPVPLEIAAPAPIPTPAPLPPRLKKKVPWKGKNIMVLLPWDDERGLKGKAPTPMSEKDVSAMLQEWEQLGYDTTGFNLGDGSDDEGERALGPSRTSWPLVKDMITERTLKSFRVSIPDKRDWDAYVEELREAKLRALGVAHGDEDPPAISPAISNNMSRRTSQQYPPLPFSPPIPTGSAASSQVTHHQNPFSPVLMPGNGMSASQSSNPGSVASPASMHAQMHGKYNARQSVSFSGNEHPFGSPFQYPQQGQSPGIWSPSQMLFQQDGVARGGSPALQNFGSLVSPASPFQQGPGGYFPQNGDVLLQMQQRQQLLQNQLALQQQLQLQSGARASPRLQDVREIENEDEAASKSPSKTPEARQIQHNHSTSLQEEIDAAEYHLEEQFQRQLEHEDYSPHSEKDEDHFEKKPATVSHIRDASAVPQPKGLAASRFATEPEDGPVLHHPQPHSRGHSLSQKPFLDTSEDSAAESKHLHAGAAAKGELSDIETNPSNLGTPHPNDLSGSGHGRAMSVSSNPWADSEANHTEASSGPVRGNSGHGSKPSVSKLNVAAKEFKFDPSSTFKPSTFSFNGNNFQAPVSAYTFVPPASTTSSHFSNPSVTSSKGVLNVAAPAFTPGNSEFSFSTSGPSFRPEVPSFTPQISNFSDSIGSGSDGPMRTSIFGNIDLSALGISKPNKKSKAIPIVRPDSSSPKAVQEESTEDKDGRIIQSDARFKRSRNAKDDGDSVPLFAEPSMPLGETNRDQSPPKESSQMPTTAADKENLAPAENSGDEEMPDAPEVPAKSHARTFSGTSPEQAAKDFAPWEFAEKKQSEDFNAARPFTSRRYGSGLPAYGFHGVSTDEEPAPVEEPTEPKGHKKSGSSLSAAAKPFEFRPAAFNFTFGQPAEPTPAPAPVPTMPKFQGLAASRYARDPTPPANVDSPEVEMKDDEPAQLQGALPQPSSPPAYVAEMKHDVVDREPSFEEIDAVMRHMNEAERENSAAPILPPPIEEPEWHQPSPTRRFQVPEVDSSSPIRLKPANLMRSDAPSPSPARFRALPGETRIFTRVHEDPFVADDVPVHHLNNLESSPPSEWDDVLSEGDEAKLQPRAQFFDNHVNSLVGGLLAERIDPLERALESIQMSIDVMAARAPSSRRERRSISGMLSDADDEDDEVNLRRSMSPRRDKKLERIRAVVAEALNAHQSSRPQTASYAVNSTVLPDSRNVLQALEEMKAQFGQSMRLDLRGEDLRSIVEEAVERRMPSSPKLAVHEAAVAREEEYKSRETEYKSRIAALEEKLFQAESDRTIRVSDLEEKLRKQESSTEEETNNRRTAEDRLSEVQRLLRIASEEEVRLRETLEERDAKVRSIADVSDLKVRQAEEKRAKTTMRIALLEAAQGNATKTESDLQNRINMTESDLRESRKEIHRWQMEAERALEAARRHSEDAEQANETNKDLRRTIESLRTQMEESIRVREGMRGKLMDLQEDVARAAREITDENARRAKKEQELVARQEVLDARLQAEARTRERLETEIERLEAGEREGMRAVSELKKMEMLVSELKMESHNAQKDAMRFQREFEEARESGMSEVQRTRHYMQAEVEAANNQVNVVREDLEHQLSKLRGDMDHIKMEADTARAKSEMLIEEAENSKKTLVAELKTKHADTVEDLQTQHERQIQNALEDATRHEQLLLERISLSSAKTQHLEDRVAHLEERLEIANAAANAAAAHAKFARSASIASPTGPQPKAVTRGMELPEKISPQALRESIMVLQEQLQARESTLEELESQISTLDPEAATKITKRDDEIMWLRELLAVRKGDLQDIITTLSSPNFDAGKVRDAAIRLRANLQMEEQERERALNGGSSLTLASLREVASPRVAQAVGLPAAVWNSWRAKSSISETMLGERSTSSTPSRKLRLNNPSPSSSFLGGLLTPPSAPQSQPTAFGSTGQRYSAAQLANRPRPAGAMRGAAPKTPPMMRKGIYDSDARRVEEAEEFGSEGGFFDDESPVEGLVGGEGFGPGPARRY